MTVKRIAFYGQPGTGTTTIATNLAAALAEAGHRVAMVGCAADGHDTAGLRQGKAVTPVLDVLRQTPQVELAQVATAGFKGILCVEIGRVAEEIEAAVALGVVNDLLTKRAARIDYVLYDATGSAGKLRDFVAPLLHNRQIEQLVAVSDAEVDGLRAINRLLQLLHATGREHRVEVAGIVGNKLPAPYAEAVIDSFARAAAIPVAAFIPQSLAITRSAFFGASLIDAAPLAHHAYLFRKAAKALVTSRPFSQRSKPLPLDEDAFTEWALDWGERLYDLGEGYVGAGGGI